MREHARVVVVGGGCVGVNLLYSLAKRGWTDVVLLERSELTAGSTWHAAGLLPLYSFSHSFGRIIAKTIEIYEGLEAETGQAVGLHKCGQLRIANSADRMDEYQNHASIAETQGVRAEILSPHQVRELWPLFTGSEDMVGGLYHPDDGHIAPADVTQALAKGARTLGATIMTHTEVTGFERTPGGDWKVRTDKGDITCEHVVTATGNYARQTGAMVGLDLPAIPLLHQYWVTEPVPELRQRHAAGLPEMPVLRDETINGYIREEGEGLMVGPYERPEKLELFAEDGVPDWFGADLLPENLEAVEENWAAAAALVPVLERTGIRNNVRGPICTTPDNLPLVGPAFGLENFWLVEGASGGILMGGGIGHYLSQWMIEGEPGIDLSEIDSRRYGTYATKAWVGIKNREAFGHNFGIHYPGYEWPAGRPLKTPPSYDRLTALGAVWGASHGWEVPNWFAPKGVEPKDTWSYRRTVSFEHVGAECKAVRTAAGLLEMTPMAKFEVEGPGAAAWLDRILANRLPPAGRIALCHLLTHKGSVRAEFTVTRLAEDRFYLVGSPRAHRHDGDVLARLLPTDGSVRLRDASAERGVLAVVGPKAREILGGLAEVELSNEAFPWLSARVATVGWAPDVRLLRVDYEGELGWELYHPIAYQLHLLEAILAAGAGAGLRLVGNRAIESLRLEKSYRAIWRDLNVEYTALEAGLDRFIRRDKGDFVGRTALLRQEQAGLDRRMVTLRVDSPDADAYMNEGVYRGDELVGRVTSGAYSHHFGHCISLAYLRADVASIDSELAVPVLGTRRPATVIADSPYDPANLRPRM